MSRLAHIGIAVADIESAIELYSLLTGDSRPVVQDVPDQKVRVAIFKGEETSSAIELVAATSPDSPVARFINKHGEGLHHICLGVEDLSLRLKQLQEAGVELIDKVPRRGAEGHLVAFVHPKGTRGVLIELSQLNQE